MNNEENQELTKKEIKSLKAQQAGKDLVDTAGKAAATYFAPGVGGEVYDAVANTKAGKKVLDTAGNIVSKAPVVNDVLAKAQPAISQVKPAADIALGSKLNKASQTKSAISGSNQLGGNLNKTPNPGTTNNPNISNVNSSQSSSDSSEITPSSQSSSDSLTKLLPSLSSKKTKFVIIGTSIFSFFIIFIIMFIIISNFQKKMLPIKYLLSLMKGDMESSAEYYAYLSGCDLDDKSAECTSKVNFYRYVDEKYREYVAKHSVEINRTLLIATLTYADPYITNSQAADKDGNEEASTVKTYKKSKTQVDLLIKYMVKEVGEKCYLEDKFGNLSSIDCSTKNNYKGGESGTVVTEPIYILDEANYREQLEKEFVIKYYLNNEKTEENKQKALEIVEEIYETYNKYTEYLNKESEKEIAYSNEKVEIMVSVTDCTGNVVLEQVTLSEYLQGVVYMNSDNDSDNYLKFLAVAAKSSLYSINNASIANMPLNLRVRNCKENQLYCSVDKGCHYQNNDGSNNDTLLIGDTNKSYFKGPADKQKLNKIKEAINKTSSDFLIDNNSFIKIDLSNLNKTEILQQLYNNSYKDVLVSRYGGSVDNVDLYTKRYPLDLINNEVTSAYGWRLDPVDFICKHHNGTDIGATLNSNIYSIADGVVVTNEESLSYGYYTVIGHGNYNNGKYDYYSLYAHQIRLSTLISVGSEVSAGQLIGNVGSTGWSTGAHLHIEIYTMENGNRNRTDPVAYFKNVDLIGKVGGTLYNSEAACKAANP